MRLHLLGVRWSCRHCTFLLRSRRSRAVGRRTIRSACLFGSNNATASERSGLVSGRNRRLALVHGSSQLWIGTGGLQVFSLCRHRCNMLLTGSRFLLRSRTRRGPTCASVVTDTVHRCIVDNRGVVNIVNVGDIDIVHRAVVIELAVVPAATLVTSAKVAKTVIDSTIEPDCWPPIARVESERDTVPAPIGRRPEESHLRGEHPRARYPVVIFGVGIPGPVTRRPDPAWSGT